MQKSVDQSNPILVTFQIANSNDIIQSLDWQFSFLLSRNFSEWQTIQEEVSFRSARKTPASRMNRHKKIEFVVKEVEIFYNIILSCVKFYGLLTRES